jgi:ATP-dependent Clp protease adaptor protein ClpS
MTATEAPTLEPDVVEATEAAERTRHAPLWKVLFHDDDVTPMDFVTAVLMRFFGHDLQTAMRIMLTVHHTGLGLAGVYPLELAELKREQVISAARPRYPLRVTIEPA